MKKKKGRWLERHPRAGVLLILLPVLLIITYGAEKILAYKNRGVRNNFTLTKRAVTLREYSPWLADYYMPAKTSPAKDFDSLAQKRYLLRIDRNGFIMPSAVHAAPNFSLVFLGGSTTECLYVDEETRFPALVGARLGQELGLKINSYNGARSGNNSLHSLDILLNKVIPLNPRFVVMMHNINDLVVLLYERSYWTDNPAKSVIIDINREILSMKNFCRIIRDRYVPNIAMEIHKISTAVKLKLKMAGKSRPEGDPGDEFAHVRGKIISPDKPAMLEQFGMNLQAFISLCRARNLTPVLMTMANRLTDQPEEIVSKHSLQMEKEVGIKYHEFKGLFDAFNEAIRQKAASQGALLIDLAREIPPNNEFMYDVVHFNNKGCERAAAVICRELKPYISRQDAKAQSQR